MELTLNRIWLTDKSSCGELFIDNGYECNTLELPIGNGGHGCAIPRGCYQVMIDFSPKFQRNMPLLVNVPSRTGIEIHWGDWPHSTQGCILLGTYTPASPDQLTPGTSVPAFNEFYTKIEQAASAGNCWVTITGGIPETETA